MLKKFIFAALAASLVFGAQDLAIKAKPASSIEETSEEEFDESQARVDECMQKDSSTAGMIQCIDAEFAIQDKLLNQNYKKAMSVLNDENKKKLKDIQRKWVAYKEAKCPFVPPMGTLYAVTAADCYLQMTKERARELASLAEDFEGNQ
ncbi:lysozyme inhibitor LprI family protein [uncultured Campylobacter sp.]|uniref:lysozyme inhibitor LprI family protein n=1 Tax=uncultured Campylobacter sp. TaxID=218934 RepID=UPI00261A7545|nr:lysozyme inhibitor LprI family protein [uncultured Campylobacter sp.]